LFTCVLSLIWIQKMFFARNDNKDIFDNCDNLVAKPAMVPTLSPVISIDFAPVVVSPTNRGQESNDSNGRNNDSYPQNAPGTFTVFKFVLFGLLIASPCLRALHLWWAGGGRIRLRRSDEDANRVVGLQYIPPMENWFGGPEPGDTERPHDRLTHEQIMSLPEIIYTKPVHYDDFETKQVQNETKYIEDDVSSDIDMSNDNEDNDNENTTAEPTEIMDIPSEDTISTNATTSNMDIVDIQEPLICREVGEDESMSSERSFENEPTLRFQLPTSPERVTTVNTSQTFNRNGVEPLSPRAIVPKEELPPDEEQQLLLQEEDTTTASVSSAQEGQQEEQTICQPVSFRTQRRNQKFTTTTCTTCSICIDEFEEGEKVRLLPRCGHAFHTDCILPWLKDRQGCCPLCKMGVLDQGDSNGENGSDGNNNNN